VRTSAEDIWAPQVIVSTGYEGSANIPAWPGRDQFIRRLLHSSEYRNPGPYRGSKVLVSGAAKVWLSARTPPNVLLRAGPGGLPGDLLGVLLPRLLARIGDAVARFGRRMDIGDLTAYGLPVPDEGVFTRLRRVGVAPTIVDQEVVEAVRAGRIEVVRGVGSDPAAPGLRFIG
jgi:cation diffusion facilitator CzcD-associated flavoprotein CzcO